MVCCFGIVPVRVSDMMCPERLQAEGKRVYAQKLPVDTYIKVVKNVYWSATAIKVLAITVVIGIAFVISYFVGTNLYKTMRFVIKRIKAKKG